MMNTKILTKEVQQYLQSNLNADVAKVALAKSQFPEIISAELAIQLTSRKKAEKKLPTWFNCSNIYYPAPLSIEQTSSEITAEYKSRLVVGHSLIDITGGFGVDAYYFSKVIQHVSHCEINTDLSTIAKHNAQILGATNISFYAENGISFLKNKTERFDTVYVDPARRAEAGKVFMLKDCTPDVVTFLDDLLEKCNRIIIKTAPLLDITAGLQELKHVNEIHIVSVKNECKELLWVIDKDFTGNPKIDAVTLNNTEKHFSFSLAEFNTEANYLDQITIEDYLYEPDAALMKSGAFNLIGERFGLKKLHPQTQLYSSATLIKEFPGRIFKIKDILSSAEIKKNNQLEGNVIVRNYPGKPEELVKKFKLKSSKEKFLIFTKDFTERLIILKADIVQYY